MKPTKLGNGNGGSNGNGDKPAEVAATPAEGAPKMEIAELVEASVLAMFFCQKLGQASAEDVREKIVAGGGEINEHLLSQALEALRARGLLSYARGRKAGGESIKMYRPRQVIWASPPEVAHLVDLLPRLVATPEAQQLIAKLNAAEEDGDGEEKARRKLGYDEYQDIVAEFLTIDQMLGSQPGSPYLDRLVKRSERLLKTSAPDDCDLRFWRDTDGALLIGADAVRGWLRTGLRTQGFADAAASYIGVSPARIFPKQPLTQTALPVVDARSGGKGLVSYETLEPGERFTLRFRIPVRGFMSPAKFRAWLTGYGPLPVRGLSPARGARFGKVALVGFNVLGETRSAKSFIGAVFDDLPEEAKRFAATVMADLEKQNIDLRRGSE